MGGRKAKFTPLFKGGGGGLRKVLLWSWGRGGGVGGKKSLKVNIISFGFFSSRTA